MKLLLDTHSIYWYLINDSNLSQRARLLIENSDNQIFISPASYWEMAIKVALGKLQLFRPYQEMIDLCLDTYGFQVLPILPAHTSQLIDLPFHHRDPFDRLLISQSMVEQIPIVSIDEKLDAYPIQRLW